ncbi:GlxA family transcriptional regulator [Vibrio ostreicida]|uniref:GlxA family transcriptional regulator n=1 Tax=Vibrio ostreicida TaxID=526588 RepID=UPI003B59A68D
MIKNSLTAPLRIAVFVIEGFAMTSVSGPIECLLSASQLAGMPKPRIDYVSPTNSTVYSSSGLPIVPTTELALISQSDVVVISSCGDPQARLWEIDNHHKTHLRRLCLSAHVIASCSGSFVLGHIDALKVATTHWLYTNFFRAQFPNIKLMPQEPITRDNNVICVSGTNNFMRATMLIVDEIFGRFQRQKCEELISSTIDDIQQACLSNRIDYRQHNDNVIHTLQNWMHAANPMQLSVAICAEKCHLSERQMKRRFKAAVGEPPMSYIQRIKLATARDKLDRTKLTIEQISYQIGYSDPNHFRELFKKFFAMTPTEYRKSAQAF